MKKNYWITLIVSIVICSLLGITGCEIPKAKYEMTVEMSAPLAPGYSGTDAQRLHHSRGA